MGFWKGQGRQTRQPPAEIAEAISWLRDDDAPLLKFHPAAAGTDRAQQRGRTQAVDAFTLQDAFTGYLALGSTGSGKTSASRSLALAYLRAGMGGLILSAKATQREADNWQELCAASGRSAQLIRFDDRGFWRFNFLDYAANTNRDSAGNLITDNIVELLLRMSEAATRSNELSGKAAEQPFWKLAPRELVSHTIDALWCAYGRLVLNDIVQFVVSIPRKAEEYASEEARERSFCLRTLHKAALDPVARMPAADLFVVLQYFRDNFTLLDERTRSNIVVTMTSQFAPFQKGLMNRLFCSHTTLVPELTHEGAIIVLDLPVDQYKEAGSMAAFLLKFCWQQAALRRSTSEAVRPIFLWADEAQYFAGEEDMKFLTVARSARACTVYLTQTISNFYAVMGGGNPRDTTAAFLANFVTKVFHRNDDVNTNQYASQLIGRELQLRASRSKGFSSGEAQSSGESYGDNRTFSRGGMLGGAFNTSNSDGKQSGINSGFNVSTGFSSNDTLAEQMDHLLEPNEFARLKNGRAANQYQVEAILFQGGRHFAANGGRPFLRTLFDQRVR